jgi:hypothetical protein
VVVMVVRRRWGVMVSGSRSAGSCCRSDKYLTAHLRAFLGNRNGSLSYAYIPESDALPLFMCLGAYRACVPA